MGGAFRSSLREQLDRLASARLADRWPCDSEVMQRELTPQTHRYYQGATSPATRSKAPFVSPKSATGAASMLWDQVCPIAMRWYGGRTSPPSEDEWPGLRAKTRAAARKKAIDRALADWDAQSAAFAERVRAVVFEFELERWREFDREREEYERKKSRVPLPGSPRLIGTGQHQSSAKKQSKKDNDGPER